MGDRNVDEALALASEVVSWKMKYEELEERARKAGQLEDRTVIEALSRYTAAASEAREKLAKAGFGDWAQELSAEKRNATSAALWVEAQAVKTGGGGKQRITYAETGIAYAPIGGAIVLPGPGDTAGVTPTGFIQDIQSAGASVGEAIRDVAGAISEAAAGARGLTTEAVGLGGQLLALVARWLPWVVMGWVLVRIFDLDIKFKAGPLKADVGK